MNDVNYAWKRGSRNLTPARVVVFLDRVGCPSDHSSWVFNHVPVGLDPSRFRGWIVGEDSDMRRARLQSREGV